jgi:CRP/FNR family transcriptional regulator, cyclic AMP receptor protein
MTIDQDKFEALRGTRLADELTEEQCRKLAQLVTVQDLKQGEILAREGTIDNRLYVILSGHLGVVKGAGSADALTINTLNPGDFVDEMGFMDGSIAYASKVALGETRVLSLERERLETLLATDPLVVYRVMRAIIRVVHQIQRRLSMHQMELSNYIYKQHGRY